MRVRLGKMAAIIGCGFLITGAIGAVNGTGWGWAIVVGLILVAVGAVIGFNRIGD
jgi:hypothetical protein